MHQRRPMLTGTRAIYDYLQEQVLPELRVASSGANKSLALGDYDRAQLMANGTVRFPTVGMDRYIARIGIELDRRCPGAEFVSSGEGAVMTWWLHAPLPPEAPSTTPAVVYAGGNNSKRMAEWWRRPVLV
ncbi:hypothetical protein U1Q18_051571 [Sarracenia purpurea var. burkii]